MQKVFLRASISEVEVAQLMVRNVPEDVKARLKRRAKRHGRSVEAEARDILARIPESAESARPAEAGLGTRLATEMRRIGVAQADIDALNQNIDELRRDRRMRRIDR